MDTTDVLIVGAGPTGLTLACDLARRGVAHRVVERAREPSSASRAKTVQPRSIEVAGDLGIAGRVLDIGAVHIPTRHYDRDRVTSEAVEAAVGVSPSPAVPYPAPVWISQPHVEGALRDRLAELGGRVEFGMALTGLGQDADGVTVTLGTGERIRARYVVGCDGGRSTVRGLTGLTLEGTSYGTHRWYLGDVRLDGLERGRQHVWMSSADGVLSLFPLPGTEIWQFQASIPAGDDDPAEPSLELYRKIFADRAGVPGVALTDAGWLSLYRVNVCMVDHYREGRVLLAGDAAHIHSPGGGQGMNTGIQDAYNLGWKLAAVLAGAPATLLDTYEAERLPVARAVLADSTDKMRMVMRAAAADDGSAAQRGLTDDFTTGLTIAYLDSPLTAPRPTGGAGARPGERAPDAVGTDPSTGGEVRLFDVFRGPRWTLLDFGGADAADTLPTPAWLDLRTHRVAGDLGREAYGVADPELVLIRPDGYIAARGDVPAISGYLRGLG